MKKRFLALFLALMLVLVGCTGPGAESSTTQPVSIPSGSTGQTELTVPEDAFPNRSSDIFYVRRVGRITGQEAFTNTAEKYEVEGTDLGFPYYDPTTGRLNVVFGDTYYTSKETGKRVWKSNVALYTTQKDYSTGLAFSGALTAKGPMAEGAAVQITPGKNSDIPLMQGDWVYNPITDSSIPTGVIMVGDTTYMFYMEIDENGFLPNGEWGVYYNRVVKSEDHGATWTQVTGLAWEAQTADHEAGLAPNFAQIFPMREGDYIYIYGVTSGRSGGTKLGRVHVDNIEDFESYEYFTGLNDAGEPNWRKGTKGLQYIKSRDSAYVIAQPCGEMCVVYNEYLGKYLALYQSGGSLVYRTADTPWGSFSAPETILKTSQDMGDAYGAFTCPELSDMGGKRIWILVSEWHPLYSVSQIEIVFN